MRFFAVLLALAPMLGCSEDMAGSAKESILSRKVKLANEVAEGGKKVGKPKWGASSSFVAALGVNDEDGESTLPSGATVTCICSYNPAGGRIVTKCNFPEKPGWIVAQESQASGLTQAACQTHCQSMQGSTGGVVEAKAKIVWLNSICR